MIRVRTPQFVIRTRPRARPGPVAVTGRSPPPPRVRPLAVGSVIVVGCFRLFRCQSVSDGGTGCVSSVGRQVLGAI